MITVRMWMLPPKLLCGIHLNGEHSECHVLSGNLRDKRSISGYIKNNCVEVMSLKERHQVLAIEMELRGYNHKSPIEIPDFSYLPIEQQFYKIDIRKNFTLLMGRCDACWERFWEMIFKKAF